MIRHGQTLEWLVRLAPALLVPLLTGAPITGLAVQGQTRRYALETLEGLSLHNVTAVPATLQGKKGLRITIAEDASGGQAIPTGGQAPIRPFAVIGGLEFSNGTIEAEIAGAPAPGAGEEARGFVGIAFRLQKDLTTCDVFYLRPTNGRAEEQERRNHAVQYTSPPNWPWFRLRKEFPSRYEAYVDLVPNVWTRIKIDVRAERARLYLHGQKQPTLIVNDLKSGPNASGAIALWLDRGTVAHFRNLTVQPLSGTTEMK